MPSHLMRTRRVTAFGNSTLRSKNSFASNTGHRWANALLPSCLFAFSRDRILLSICTRFVLSWRAEKSYVIFWGQFSTASATVSSTELCVFFLPGSYRMYVPAMSLDSSLAPIYNCTCLKPTYNSKPFKQIHQHHHPSPRCVMNTVTLLQIVSHVCMVFGAETSTTVTKTGVLIFTCKCYYNTFPTALFNH